MSDIYDEIRTPLEMFESYLSDYENATFTSLQGAYRQWLLSTGFHLFGDNYAVAVQIILTFLSRCIANPRNRYFVVEDNVHITEWAPLQISAPDIHGDYDTESFWEFFSEDNFHRMYRDWRQSRSTI